MAPKASVKRRPAKQEERAPKRKGKVVAKAGTLTVTEVAELDDLRRELERAAGGSPLRWNADPDEVQRSASTGATLVEFIRGLERQPPRMEGGTRSYQKTRTSARADETRGKRSRLARASVSERRSQSRSLRRKLL